MTMRLTPAVKVLLIACFAAFLVQQTVDTFMGGNLFGWLALVPSGFVNQHRLWQIVTYAFLHADPMHLFLNLMMLAFIGGEIEARWGTRRFLQYYFFCAVAAGLFYLLLQAFMTGGFGAPMVGASGAIYGLLMAYGIIFGERVMLFMMLFPMKAKVFVWVLAGIELMSTVFSRNGGLAGAAHLGGMAAGYGYLWGGAAAKVLWRQRIQNAELRKKEKRRKSADHLKLVINNAQKRVDEDESDPNPKTWH